MPFKKGNQIWRTRKSRKPTKLVYRGDTLDTVQTKTCCYCKKELLVNGNFNRNRHAKDGLQVACNTCRRGKSRGTCAVCHKERNLVSAGMCSNCRFNVYIKPYPDKLAAFRIQSRKYIIKRKYGVTPEWYEATLENQGGKCAICGVTDNGKTKYNENLPFCIDHNHETGEVRGLICTSCNQFVGLLESNLTRYVKVKLYLKRYDNVDI